jgi:hypothetical protein
MLLLENGVYISECIGGKLGYEIEHCFLVPPFGPYKLLGIVQRYIERAPAFEYRQV